MVAATVVLLRLILWGRKKINGQVVFDYDILSKSLAKTDVDAKIATVKYAFSSTNAEKEAFTDIKDAYTYTYTFEHKSEAYEQQVTIDEVNISADKVICK